MLKTEHFVEILRKFHRSSLVYGLGDEELELGVEVDGLEVEAVVVKTKAGRRVRLVHHLQALVQVVLNTCNVILCLTSLPPTCIAVSDATMAGDPKPWVTIEKLVRCLWMPGSRIG